MMTFPELIRQRSDAFARARAAGNRDETTRLGRELAELRFDQDLDRWIDDVSAFRTSRDPLLAALADGDHYLEAALHLRAAGRAIPEGWTSPQGTGV